MLRLRKFVCFLAAGLVMLTLAVVVETPTARAANKVLSYDCTTPGNAPQTGISLGAGETFTLTVGASCIRAVFNESSASYSLLPLTGTLNGSTFTPNSGSPTTVSPGDVIVVTAPASGFGVGSVQLANNSGTKTFQIATGFPDLTGSMVDNSDGTFTVTFTGGLRDSVTGNGGFLTLALLAEGSTCPADVASLSPNALTMNSQQGSGWVSPMTITSQTLFNTNGPSVRPNGNYEACLYSTDGFASAGGLELPTFLLQSLPVTLGTPPISASMVDNSDGTMTVTYDLTGRSPGESVAILFYPAGQSCTPFSPNFSFSVLGAVGGGVGSNLAASPAVLSAGSDMNIPNSGSGQIPAGTFTACLIAGSPPAIQEFQMTFSAAAPTTTTTVAPTTTTTVAPTTTTTAPGSTTTTTVVGSGSDSGSSSGSGSGSGNGSGSGSGADGGNANGDVAAPAFTG